MAGDQNGTKYILVGADEGALMELPTEVDGSILLSTIQSQYQNAIGLKFFTSSGSWRGVRRSGNILYPPIDGWCERHYIVVAVVVLTQDVVMDAGPPPNTPNTNSSNHPSTSSSNMIHVFKLEDEDVLLHYNIFSSSQCYSHRLVKTGTLKNIISMRESLIDDFACMRKSGRSVDQKSLLLCAGIHYIVHKDTRQIFCDNINDLCKIPTDLFQLMNLISNKDLVNSNFKKFVDQSQINIEALIETNRFKKKEKKKKRKRKKKNAATVETTEVPPVKKKSDTVEDIADEISDVTLEENVSLKENMKKEMGNSFDADGVSAKKVKKDTVDGLAEGIEVVTLDESDIPLTPEKSKIQSFIQQHKFIKQWYCDPNKTALDLLYMLTKFRSRYGWDHKMILQHSNFRFKGKGLPKSGMKESKEGDESMDATDAGESKGDPQWEGGDCNLVINYVVHGATQLKNVEKYRKYLEQCDETEYKEEGVGVEEIHSQILSGIYVLENSKLKLGEKWDDEEKATKVSDMIKKFIRTPVIPGEDYYSKQGPPDFSPYYLMPGGSDDEEDCGMMMVLPDDDDQSGVSSEKVLTEKKGEKFLRFHVCAEHLPAPLLNSPKIWEALIKDMPMSAFIRQICHTARLGLFNDDGNIHELIDKMKCPSRLRRVHPFQVLEAVMEYHEGMKKGNRKEKQWAVDPTIYEKLCEAVCLSLKYCPRGVKDTFSNLKYKICIESSGPMLMSGFIGNQKLSGTRAAVAMSLAIKKFFKRTEICICGEDEVYKPGDRIDVKIEGYLYEDANTSSKIYEDRDLVNILERIRLIQPRRNKGIIQHIPLSMHRRKSDLAQPITRAINSGEKVDAFVVFTLSDRNNLMGKSPYAEFGRYRTNINPAAKLILCTMDARSQIIADPNDENVKVLCGVDAYLLHGIIRYMSPDKHATENLCKFCCCEHRRGEAPAPEKIE